VPFVTHNLIHANSGVCGTLFRGIKLCVTLIHLNSELVEVMEDAKIVTGLYVNISKQTGEGIVNVE